MNFILQPWQLLLLILAPWINEEQQRVIEFLHTENAVLKEKLGKKRILLSDDQRRRLAVKGKILGRKLLEQFGDFPQELASALKAWLRNEWPFQTVRFNGPQ